MKYFLAVITAFLFLQNISAQDSVYTTKFWVDGPVILGGLGLTAVGVSLVNSKKDLTMAQLATKTKDKIPFFDRGNAGYYSENADNLSYIPFEVSFGIPLVMGLINKNERQKYGQVLVLYGETMAITGALFTLTDGTINRSRPYVYGTNAPLDKRLGKNAQRSFFAGHTAATAAATFFAAKAFQDFNPDSKAKPYVWAAAAAIPGLVGYLRYKAGMHFLSDNIVGFAIGAGVGILVPQLHKNKIMKNITFMPAMENGSKGIAVFYVLQ